MLEFIVRPQNESENRESSEFSYIILILKAYGCMYWRTQSIAVF